MSQFRNANVQLTNGVYRLKVRSLAVMAIAGLSLLMGGCSITQLGYNNGPHLAWWWLDGYVDFDREQKPHAKQAIQAWFNWHRSEQLPAYAEWLTIVRSGIDGRITPEQACSWSDELQEIIAPALDHAVQLGTPVALRLGEAQWRYLEKQYQKSNDKLRRKYLQPDVEDRLNASVKRTVKRIENLYGRIDKKQRALIITAVKASPFAPDAWLLERQRRQQVTLSTLQRIATEPAPFDKAAAELRQLVAHTHRSDDADYRAYQLRLSEYTCGFIARLHNSTTPKQRQHAHDKLAGWETDITALINDNRHAANQVQIATE